MTSRIRFTRDERDPWEGAACRQGYDPDLWFPDGYTHVRYASGACVPACKVCRPVRICFGCPLRTACLEATLRTEARSKFGRFGIYGGLTPSQRHTVYMQDPDRWARTAVQPPVSQLLRQELLDRISAAVRAGRSQTEIAVSEGTTPRHIARLVAAIRQQAAS